jgi:hypothetical protein
MTPRTFAVAITVEDPLTAERLVDVLQEAQIDAFSRAGGAAASGPFSAAAQAFWDLFVPTDVLSRAEPLIRAELEAIEKDGEANARAAEEEALSGENPVG